MAGGKWETVSGDFFVILVIRKFSLIVDFLYAVSCHITIFFLHSHQQNQLLNIISGDPFLPYLLILPGKISIRPGGMFAVANIRVETRGNEMN